MFVISLYSKYTGESIHLGSSYKTRKKAEAEDYCTRCNSINIHEVPDDFVWSGKEYGFVCVQERDLIKRPKVMVKQRKARDENPHPN